MDQVAQENMVQLLKLWVALYHSNGVYRPGISVINIVYYEILATVMQQLSI